MVRSLVTRYLSTRGVRVAEATNGAEGVAAAKQHRPDLVLLDVMIVRAVRPVLGAPSATITATRPAAARQSLD